MTVQEYGTSHTLRSGMKGNFHVPFWREVGKGNFLYSPNPTSAQRLELAQTFGCTRFVYNWALALRTNSYYQDNVSLSYTDTSNALTKLKKDPEKPWLKQVSAVPLQQGLRHLNTAFINFFAGRSKYPRFKKKNNRQSAHYAPNAFKWDGTNLTLAKMSQPLRIKWSRHFTGQPRSVTVSQRASRGYKLVGYATPCVWKNRQNLEALLLAEVMSHI